MKNRQKIIKTIAFIVSFVIFSFIGRYAVSTLFNSTSTADLMQGPWQVKEYGSPAITLELPVELKERTLTLPEEVKQYIVQMHTYMYETKDMVIMVNNVNYNPSIVADLQGAANGSVNEMRNRGITNLTYDEAPITLPNMSGIRQTGTFEENNQKLEFTNVIFTNNSDMWQVLVGYPEGDAEGKQIRERIINSIRISKRRNQEG